MKKIKKILIANRGEIAVRVINTARSLGYRTVAVYSDADINALHVKEADQAVCIGAAPVNESYLVAEKILAAAISSGSDAIHPGYGFLSENAEFANACEKAGIIFIGPPAHAIDLMGSKRLSKIAMIKAGVPCIPGYHNAEQSDEVLISKASEVGFPLMVKASAGGGGRGMRLVWQESVLPEQIKTARSEAINAFGSGELILERAVIEPRHIEIQVFADNHGNAVYLAERDCSIQRRHQKVVEEAPSPFVDEDLRELMGKAAVDAALSCQYRGAGTVEFLVDKDKNFYFLEMNTRLQVEHPVTELITGQDLVAWQLQVADGGKLPLSQDEITINGHAIEVRIYAEDPRNEFLPQTGTIKQWQLPTASKSQTDPYQQKPKEGLRFDHGIAVGQYVTPYYDPMVAKVIAFGEERNIAARRLASAVQDVQLLGVNNNKLFLQNILRHPVFLDGEATTAFIEDHFQHDVSMEQKSPTAETLAKAAVLYFYAQEKTMSKWQNTADSYYQYKLDFAGEIFDVQLSKASNSDTFSITVLETIIELTLFNFDPELAKFSATFNLNGLCEETHFVIEQDHLFMDDGTGHFIFENITHQPAKKSGAESNGEIKASMDGSIVDVLVKEGDQVKQGQTLVVLEAMKMEHQLKASSDGIVESVNTRMGNQVKTKQLLLKIAPCTTKSEK
ncbi:MAG: acetyl/propionyl/methylcrotonyl-CoA carboxylase subunit alpha [Alteromonadales bacterium]|nr:acetyl/propionyl/methylcrotonyl-CoA carboxylase subunit alpha [Alteromonadales bacterium]